MNCPGPTEIARHFDKELSAERAAIVEDHLPTCPACAAEYDALARLRAALNQSPGAVHDLGAPPGFAAAVGVRIRAEKRLLGATDRWLERRRAPEWAALALGLSFIWLIFAAPLSRVGESDLRAMKLRAAGELSSIRAATTRAKAELGRAWRNRTSQEATRDKEKS